MTKRKVFFSIITALSIASINIIATADVQSQPEDNVDNIVQLNDDPQVFYFDDRGGITTNPINQSLYLTAAIRPIDLYGQPLISDYNKNYGVCGMNGSVIARYLDDYPTNIYNYEGVGAVFNGGHPYSGVRYSNSAVTNFGA